MFLLYSPVGSNANVTLFYWRLRKAKWFSQNAAQWKDHYVACGSRLINVLFNREWPGVPFEALASLIFQFVAWSQWSWQSSSVGEVAELRVDQGSKCSSVLMASTIHSSSSKKTGCGSLLGWPPRDPRQQCCSVGSDNRTPHQLCFEISWRRRRSLMCDGSWCLQEYWRGCLQCRQLWSRRWSPQSELSLPLRRCHAFW